MGIVRSAIGHVIQGILDMKIRVLCCQITRTMVVINECRWQTTSRNKVMKGKQSKPMPSKGSAPSKAPYGKGSKNMSGKKC